MFKAMRRTDRKLDHEEAWSILKEGRAGTLCLAGGDYPYGIPMNYFVQDGDIWMHGARDAGEKDLRIGHDNRVCFSVFNHVEGAKFNSVVVYGRIEPTDDDATVAHVLEGIVKKYIPEVAWQNAMKNIPGRVSAARAYRVTVDHIEAKYVDRP